MLRSFKQLSGIFRFSAPKVVLSVLSLLLLSACGFQSEVSGSSSTQSTSQQSSTPEIHGIVSQLHMIDATTGWVQSWYSSGGIIHNDILRTVDGGVHWKVMLSCLPDSSDGGKAAGFATCLNDFHTSNVATVLEPLKNNQSRIYHTSDGGQTWRSTILNARALLSSPVFVDGQHGWFLATEHFPGRNAESSYIGQDITLFRTSDGGNSWQRLGSGNTISQLPVTSSDGYGTLPPFTANARMTFTNPTKGWIIGASYQTNTSWLYVTHDAGNTWQHVGLSISSQAMAVWTPSFFDEHNGLFPVLVEGSAPQTAIYSTYDGGKTWTQSAFVPFDVTNGVFFSMNAAWTYGTSSLEKTFYTTHDGWKHWTKSTTISIYKQLYGFSFVSPKIGWALGENRTEYSLPEPGGGRRPGDIISILKTTDGGLTW